MFYPHLQAQFAALNCRPLYKISAAAVSNIRKPKLVSSVTTSLLTCPPLLAINSLIKSFCNCLHLMYIAVVFWITSRVSLLSSLVIFIPGLCSLYTLPPCLSLAPHSTLDLIIIHRDGSCSSPSGSTLRHQIHQNPIPIPGPCSELDLCVMMSYDV